MPIPKNQPVGGNAGATWDIQDHTTSAIAKVALPRVRPNPSFFLMHHHENWAIETEGLDDPTWLPLLQHEIVSPGLNTHRTLKKGEPSSAAYERAQAILKRRGFTILPHDIKIDGVVGYMKTAKVAHPLTGREGLVHFERWEYPRAKRDGKRQKYDLDRGEMNRFRLRLVELGHIRPPTAEIVAEGIDIKALHVDRAASNMDITAELRKSKTDRATRALERATGAKIPQPIEMVEVRAKPEVVKFDRTITEIVAEIADGMTVPELLAMLDGETRKGAKAALTAAITAATTPPSEVAK